MRRTTSRTGPADRDYSNIQRGLSRVNAEMTILVAGCLPEPAE
ncbi:hypothetical protein [Halogranum rubrum]|uniref:Uncharacterized protein n=1 Tax=Halogranum salarium B-1 TaxID=1210908 RepID=J2ZXX7_9EURY|nr:MULTISPECIES: hypothetical protein [Halogranum]EJN57878.1 hypothetical protein HSB1_32950 [Halogranum salarium B-1]